MIYSYIYIGIQLDMLDTRVEKEHKYMHLALGTDDGTNVEMYIAG